MKRSYMAIVSCAAVLAVGMAAALPLYGPFTANTGMNAGPSALSLYGIATLVHYDADGNVLGEQTVHNRLLDAGEDFILRQVFMDGQTSADAAQIGAICLSADNSTIVEGLTAAVFNTNHEADAETVPSSTTPSTISHGDTRECLTDIAVASSGQIATVGPLTFTANNTDSPDASRSNWKPGVPIKMIGICQGFGAVSAASCTAPLFAAVDINDVTLDNDETLTVTYTFDMRSATT